jgi:hypothetical protein
MHPDFVGTQLLTAMTMQDVKSWGTANANWHIGVVLQSHIMAAKAVASTLKTSLGPNGGYNLRPIYIKGILIPVDICKQPGPL